ncbi:MAG TPA: hypothetical protein VFJ15_08715 [Oleiagrimonas sp.]|nr:hypothetical protein [Oleiagrimonas sp.]
MKSQTPRNFAELIILLLGGLHLSIQGTEHVIAVFSALPALPITAYGAGELAGQLINAAYPLVIGAGLLIIACRRRRPGRVLAQDVRHGA